jgi:hypothetical protein
MQDAGDDNEGVDWVPSGRRGSVSKESVRRHEARTIE